MKADDLEILQISLEKRRSEFITLILEREDDGAGPEEIKGPRLTLTLINQELSLAKNQINARREPMGFETAEQMKVIKKYLGKAADIASKEIIPVRDAEVKVQTLVAQMSKFEGHRTELVAENDTLKAKVLLILNDGGDPSDLNREIRAKAQEVEDLAAWIAHLEKVAIPEAEKLLAGTQDDLWHALTRVANEGQPIFGAQVNDLLAQAAEIAHSWQAAVQEFFAEYRAKQPAYNSLQLAVDGKRSFFQDPRVRSW